MASHSLSVMQILLFAVNFTNAFNFVKISDLKGM